MTNTYVRCVRHKMRIRVSSSTELRHERYGDRCDSKMFTVVEERQVNAATAHAELLAQDLREKLPR